MTTASSEAQPRKPGKVQAIAIMNLVDGILNVLWSLGIAVGILSIGLATLGIGCLLLPIAAYPMIVGIFAIISASKLLPNNPTNPEPARTLAIMQIINILTGNVVSLGVGIAALVLYGDPEVEAYFEEHAAKKR